MYRYIFSIFLIFVLGSEARSLLYRVDSHNSTVYILGSIHLAKPELYPLDKEINEAYTKSEILVVELDPSSEESIKSIEKALVSSGMYAQGKDLNSELTAKTYKALNEYMVKTGQDVSEVQRMRPWMAMLKLSVDEMVRLGYSPELGIDAYFLDQARLDNKMVISLETAEEQMALLSKDDKDFQDRLLRYTLESMDDFEPILNDMFFYWKTGDAEALDNIISIPLKTEPELKMIYDELILKRNHMMSEKIESFLKTDKSYFIVVGSGHVVGEEGIIALLKQKGYMPTQK